MGQKWRMDEQRIHFALMFQVRLARFSSLSNDLRYTGSGRIAPVSQRDHVLRAQPTWSAISCWLMPSRSRSCFSHRAE